MRCVSYHSGLCRSCSHLDRTSEQSLADRTALLRQLFPAAQIKPWNVCSSPGGSRIRARFAVSGTPDDPTIGFFDMLRRIVPLADCPLHDPRITDWVHQLPDLIRDGRLTPYDPASDRGELKYVVVTASPSHGALMVQLVLRSREALDRVRRLVRTHAAFQHPVTVVAVNLQPVRSSLINGPQDLLLTENRWLPISFGNQELLFGPGSFVQTNYEMAACLYARAAEELRVTAPERVLDLYCGAGAFAITSASGARQVVGVDVAPEAIDGAREAARRAGYSHVTFHCSDLSDRGEPALADFDVIICNPPRRGLDTAALNLLEKIRPRVVVYSSCNPESLARNLNTLKPAYRLRSLEPFDMFPWNSHCEVLALLDLC